MQSYIEESAPTYQFFRFSYHFSRQSKVCRMEILSAFKMALLS